MNLGLKQKKMVLIAVAVVACGGVLFAANQEPTLLPVVQKWVGAEGMLSLKNNPIVVDSANKKELGALAQRFQAELKMLNLGDHAITSSAKAKAGDIFLSLRDGEGVKGSYTLEIGNNVKMRANSVEGVLYATRTVLQMLVQNRQTLELPRASIVDYPVYRQRMLMLDVGRKAFPIPVLEDYIRILAWYKMNELHLHLSDQSFDGKYACFRIESKVFPDLAAKDLHYTQDEIRALVKFAKGYGVTITPEFDMPGHSRCFTDYWPDIMVEGHSNYIDVTNPKTIKLMKQLLDEMIPLFDSPDIHIGTDEYRVGHHYKLSKERVAELHEGFRQFINTMNAHVRSKGKNCRIWSGYHAMGGKTKIDPTVTIDMWIMRDAKKLMEAGHVIINSNQMKSYIVPGTHYYGVSLVHALSRWRPNQMNFKEDSKNPAPDDPKFLGAKLHVWMDQGPTGWTMSEIGDITFRTLHVFSQRLWGSEIINGGGYPGFVKRAALCSEIPEISLMDRIPSKDGIYLDIPEVQSLKTKGSIIELPFAKADRADLEYPWTLSFQVRKTKDANNREVIFSSDKVEICNNYDNPYSQRKIRTADNKRVVISSRPGFALVRAAGGPGKDPAGSALVERVSHVYANPLELNEWTSVVIVAEQGKTSVYINDLFAGSHPDQMVAPMRWLGSKTGNSFVGDIRNIKLQGKALKKTPEVMVLAGYKSPVNLALQANVTTSIVDEKVQSDLKNITDGRSWTEWKSNKTTEEQWVVLDLGEADSFSRVCVDWSHHGFPDKFSVETSLDNKSWREVYTGASAGNRSTIIFPGLSARYLRLKMSEPLTNGGNFRIHEILVYKESQNR